MTREFVVSIDTAHVRASRAEAGRNFEIVVARCGRGGRGSRPDRYFTTADTAKRELQSRTLQALQSEGYAGHGEVTILSDGAEIMKRLPKTLPQPTAHIIDRFQPLQQIADHVARWHDGGNSEMAHVDANVRSLKWKLWHGQTDRALDHLETMTNEFRQAARARQPLGDAPIASGAPTADVCPAEQKRVYQLRRPLSIATALTESAVNSLVARRMVKKQQIQWSKRGAHLRFKFAPPFSTAIFRSASLQAAETCPSIEDRMGV